MYRIKGSKAYSHGCYIRPGGYIELWRDIARLAKEAEVSVSEFVSHHMHLQIYQEVSPNSRMVGMYRKKKKVTRG